MKVWVITANILGWPVIHIVIARLILALPLARFSSFRPASPRTQSRESRVYRNILFVHRWKAKLPDGAPWLGGFSKKHFTSRDSTYIATFILETRRAECAHWCMFFCFPLFFLWNPPWARVVMFLYALAANMPCIVAQRYNRIALTRLLLKTRRRAAPSRASI